MNLFTGILGEQARRAGNEKPCVWCPCCHGHTGGIRQVFYGPDVIDEVWEDCTMCAGEGIVGGGQPQRWM